METHGVEAARINAPMTAQDYKLFVPVGRFTRSFLTALPIIALGLAYAATQLAAFFKARPPPFECLCAWACWMRTVSGRFNAPCSGSTSCWMSIVPQKQPVRCGAP